jgi:hypothetical protein
MGKIMRYLPTVTEVIKPWVDFSGIPEAVLNHAGKRGTFVHDICLNFHAQGLPFLGEIPEDCKGFIESFDRWLEKVVTHVEFVERRLFDAGFRYSGQIDMLALVGIEAWLIDLKTPLALSKSWRVRLAAYRHLCIEAGYHRIDRIGSLRLDKDGKLPKMDWYDGSADQDFNIFLSALNCHRFFNQ